MKHLDASSSPRLAVLGAALAMALAACSTPQPALDHANFTAAMVGELESELGEFRRIAAAKEQLKLRSLAEQERTAAVQVANTTLARGIRAANGDAAAAQLESKLTLVTDLVEKADTSTKTAMAQSDSELSKLLKPLPSTVDKTTAAQKALAQMGTELPKRTRLAEARAFFSKIKESVDANREKIKKAEEAAAAAAKKE